MQKCLNCRYWNDNGFPQHRTEWNTEQCRKHAPVNLKIHTDNSYGSGPEWPRTTGRDWCGDWEEMIREQSK